MSPLILATASTIRADLLRRAGVDFVVEPVRIDEVALRESLLADGATPHDIADALAESKARRSAVKNPHARVLGFDQILDCGGTLYTKPTDLAQARAQLQALGGQTHRLHTAVVLYDRGRPVWRHVATSLLTMRPLSDTYIDAYLARTWDQIRHCVGCYQIEAEGVRLFSRIDGDLFAIQGVPLLEVLNVLTQRKELNG